MCKFHDYGDGIIGCMEYVCVCVCIYEMSRVYYGVTYRIIIIFIGRQTSTEGHEPDATAMDKASKGIFCGYDKSSYYSSCVERITIQKCF